MGDGSLGPTGFRVSLWTQPSSLHAPDQWLPLSGVSLSPLLLDVSPQHLLQGPGQSMPSLACPVLPARLLPSVQHPLLRVSGELAAQVLIRRTHSSLATP